MPNPTTKNNQPRAPITGHSQITKALDTGAKLCHLYVYLINNWV